ncbi:hypothetical protein Nepgr_014018 [Nepenthes gracilis]|uniref:Uncharacterized protein n=1 Tax=Nepenthes gracilis TaxID=150966 RepID=A0AAD3XP60_NEPGR|nr:hypothetical protein Nepgr_014018 [Nepenthes gracilis]
MRNRWGKFAVYFAQKSIPDRRSTIPMNIRCGAAEQENCICPLNEGSRTNSTHLPVIKPSLIKCFRALKASNASLTYSIEVGG